MRQIPVQPLTAEDFAPFGQFYSMTSPQGYALCGPLHQFYPTVFRRRIRRGSDFHPLPFAALSA